MGYDHSKVIKTSVVETGVDQARPEMSRCD